MTEVCMVMVDAFADIDDESARCRKPAVGRLPGELDFPVCEYHQEIFSTPRRIHLRRVKGWRIPPNTVKVDRSTKWGNPWKVEPSTGALNVPGHLTAATADEAVMRFRWLFDAPCNGDPSYPDVDTIRYELCGKNLACWCPPSSACHVDVLLEVANP